MNKIKDIDFSFLKLELMEYKGGMRDLDNILELIKSRLQRVASTTPQPEIDKIRADKERIITDTIKWKQLACDRQHLIDTRDYQITTLTEQVKELRGALETVVSAWESWEEDETKQFQDITRWLMLTVGPSVGIAEHP